MNNNIYLTNREKELIAMLIDFYFCSGSSLSTDETLENELSMLDTKINKSKKRRN